MAKRLLRTLAPEQLRGRRVLVRADLNVPLDGDTVTDETRIRASLPTLEYLAGAGARVILMSHLGRPKGSPDPASSLAPVAQRLAALSPVPVHFVADTVGDEARSAAAALPEGEILLLENTRFLPGETEDDPSLGGAMAALGDLYVNDAFGSAHRAHASTAGVARAVKASGGLAVAGLLMERELSFLGDALDNPERPFVAILGGAKISGKIDVVEALLPRVDQLLIGGAMANTFLLALGLPVGGSLVEDDRVDMARELMERAGERLLLPVDCRVSHRLAADAEARVVARDGVGDGEVIGDIGPETEGLFREAVRGARTILWNGPMGVFEMAPFAHGTLAVARAVAEATDAGATSVLGGGDSAAAAEVAGVTHRLTHVSTGGGASLEFLAGAELPGVAVLSDQEG
ncbi:MAG TPA: phosphoglycerate kinase [Longimicrobiales bacterium]|nr:phosphoglycerate kinase [Longimicrobiales bacterium]